MSQSNAEILAAAEAVVGVDADSLPEAAVFPESIPCPSSSGLELRHWRTGDQDSLRRNADNPKIARGMRNLFPSPYTESDAQWWVDYCEQVLDQDRPDHVAIAVDGVAVGSVGITHRDRRDIECRTAEIGYWMGEDYWGKGIMSKVVCMWVEYVWRAYPHLERLEATVFSWNVASRRVLEKCGFSFEGLRRRAYFKNGEFHDGFALALLREEWKGIDATPAATADPPISLAVEMPDDEPAVVLRRWTRGDLDSLCKHADNAKVAQFTSNRFPHPYTRADAEQFMARLNAEPDRARPSQLAITVDGEAVGAVMIFPNDPKSVQCRTAEIGYWLGEAFWDRGITTRAMRVWLAHCWRVYPDLHRLQGAVFGGNRSSCRVLEKLGFQLEGVQRQVLWKHGELHDEHLYALLRGEVDE